MNARSISIGTATLALGGVIGFCAGRAFGPPPAPAAVIERPAIPAPEPPDEFQKFVTRPPAYGDLGPELMLRADRDPRAALAELETIAAREGEGSSRDFYKTLFRNWALRDMEGALAGLERVVHGARWAAGEEVLNILFEQDPQRAADLMNGGRFPAGLPKWLTENPIEACKLVPKIASSQDGADHFSFARAWAYRDPEGALEWAESLTGWQRTKAMDDIVAPWVMGDLEGAIHALESGRIEALRMRQNLEQQIARALGKTSPLEAIERMSNSRTVYDHDRWRTIFGIVKSWAKRDPGAVIEWTQAQQGAKYRKAGLEAVGARWAEADPAAAAEFVASGSGHLQAIPELATQVGSQFLQLDPAAALNWVDQLAPGVRSTTEAHLFKELFHQDRHLALTQFEARLARLSPPAVETLSAEYFKADAAAARLWVEGLPRGLAYESALAGIELAANESEGE